MEKKFDTEILKDLICESDSSVKRENIIFENVWFNNDFIISPYRELIWSNNFSTKMDVYLDRVKQKERNEKINNIL